MKKMMCSPPKPTRTVMMQLPTNNSHSVHRSATLTKLTELPTVNTVLPDRPHTLSTTADVNSQRAPSLLGIASDIGNKSRVLVVPAMPEFPIPVRSHARLPDSLPCETLTPESVDKSSTGPLPSHQDAVSVPMEKEANASLESLLVDRAIENMMSLPDVMGEVAVKQREQTDELRRQHLLLDKETQKLKEDEKEVEKVKQELQSVKRQTWLMEEKVAQIQQQCQQLESDIKGVINHTMEMTLQLELKQETLECDGAMYRKCVEQMRRHVEQVEALESSCVINQTLREQRHTVEKLRKQKQDLATNAEESHFILTGVFATHVQEEIEGLKEDILKLDNKRKCSIQQVQSGKNRQHQLKQDIHVLQKRNTAQLTRLRRQLKLSQCRNRQWSVQAAQLERTVSTLKQQLEV